MIARSRILRAAATANSIQPALAAPATDDRDSAAGFRSASVGTADGRTGCAEKRRAARLPQGRVVHASVVGAQAQAAEVLVAARAQAAALLSKAELDAAELRRLACEEGKAEAAAAFSAAWIRLRQEEASKDERDSERIIELARALAERLLGEALQIDPNRIVSLAREALVVARQARAVTVLAHPEDAEVLQRRWGEFGLPATVVKIQVAADRPRGSLLLRTDLGIIDADIALQLDRLILALRDDSGHGP